MVLNILHVGRAPPPHHGIQSYIFKVAYSTKKSGQNVTILTPLSDKSIERKLNDLEIIEKKYYSGIFNYIRYLVSIILIAFRKRSGVPLGFLLTLLRFIIYRTPFNPFLSIFTFLTVSQHLNERKYDIIHFHYPYDEGMGVIFAAKMFNIPTVATIFGGMIAEASEKNPRTIPFLRYVINNTDAPFSITGISRKVTLNLGDIEKFIKIIPVGVDYEKYSEFEVDREEFRKNLGISDDEKVVLFVGPLLWRKAPDVLLEALAHIPEWVKWKALLVGPEFDEGIVESLINLSKNLGIKERVIFTGEVSEEFLISCYKISDLLVSYPRTQITTAIMPVVEAVASGITVVAASIGALPEYIIDGKNGFLIKPNEPEILAEKITGIITNPKKNKIDRNIVREKFSWNVISRRFVEMYMNLNETKG